MLQLRQMPRLRMDGVVSKTNGTTISVQVTKSRKDPKYGKSVTYTKQYLAHDKHQEAKIGDRVTIVESRPISKTKKFIKE